MRIAKFFVAIVALIFVVGSAYAYNGIIPRPVEFEKRNGVFTILTTTKITHSAELRSSAKYLAEYLPLEVQKIISKELDISLEHIYGVVTFYAQFSLSPKGEYQIGVCLGTACYVKGSGDILEKFKELLKIDVDGCTPDGKFSLEATRCIGACGLAPVFTINEDVYGRITADDVPAILAKYQG